MWKERVSYFFNEIIQFLTNKQFIKNILGMIAVCIVMLLLVMLWLRFYTNHGQKLEVPQYIDQDISSAQKDAKKKSFELIVNDSVHIVGKAGGIIQNQNPPYGSQVKEGRKIYVDITKYQADIIELADALPLYGQDYELKKAELARKTIYSEIKEFRYDGLSSNTILEVWKGAELLIDVQKDLNTLRLPKGTTLSFVVSTQEGGSHEIPALVGNSVKTARWIVERNRLRIGTITWQGEIGEEDEAEVVSQSPVYDGISSLSTGSSVDIVIMKRGN